jgi:hypothetical protein
MGEPFTAANAGRAPRVSPDTSGPAWLCSKFGGATSARKSVFKAILKLSYRARRKFRWAMARRWAVIRLRRRIVLSCLMSALICAAWVSVRSPRVYSSRATIDTGVVACEHGFPVRYGCSRCEENKLPLALRALTRASRISDDLAWRAGWDTDFEGKINRLRQQPTKK